MGLTSTPAERPVERTHQRKSRDATLFAAFLHVDVSFASWVILIIFASPAVVGAILLVLVGRAWSSSFLTRGQTPFALSFEEG